MSLRTDQSSEARSREANRASEKASRTVPARYPIQYQANQIRPNLGERIIAAARVASAMHMTGASLIAADEAAIRALDSREASA